MKKTWQQKLIFVFPVFLAIAVGFILYFMLKGPDYTHHYNGPVTCIVYDSSTVMDLSESQEAYILTLLNNGEWQYDVTNCSPDYEFVVENQTIRYHSSCSTLVDIKKRQHNSLSEEDAKLLNEVLGIE